MAVIEEGKKISDFLKWELDKNFCREVLTFATGQNLKAGSVVGILDATGLAKSIYLITGEEEAPLDGSQDAVGLLLEDVNASGGAKAGVVLSRGAIVTEDFVIYPGAASAAHKAKAKKDLSARGISIRETV
jgi:hypothetical protein